MTPPGHDVFLSYAHADRPEWVRTLAENLEQMGFDVFLDAWEITGGNSLIARMDHWLLAGAGVLVVTRSTFERPHVRAEYEAMMERAIAGKMRLVAVVVDDVDLPPLLSRLGWIDFRGADGEEYLRRLQELARSLRGRPPANRPALTGEIAYPPGSAHRPEGPLRRTLRIARHRVVLLAGDEEIAAHDVAALDPTLETKVYELARARGRRIPPGSHLHREPASAGAAKAPAAEPPDAPLHRASLDAGAALGRSFLAGAAGEALRAALREAERLGSALELGLEIAGDDLPTLPWETLRLPEPPGPGAAAAPSEPLALHPRVHLYRRPAGEGAVPAHAIPGPLRILVAIGSPEAQTRTGELLDYERELEQILDAVEPARAKGQAVVRVLRRGTVQAIHDALAGERFHVLHISCHADPGELILETDEGKKDKVSAERLWQEALPADHGVPLVVLAGCATGLAKPEQRPDSLASGPAGAATGGAAEKEGERALPALAGELVAHGVPAVLAMQASVGDRYATLLAGALYGGLAVFAEPAPLAALARARREVERLRLEAAPGSPERPGAEWATPALYLRGAPQRLYDPAAPFETIAEAPEARFAPGVVARKVGEFVGRRREERLLLATLRGEGDAGGAVIRGMGGVGKSSLAAEVLSRLAEEGRPVVSVVGETSPEAVLEAVGKHFFLGAVAAGLPENHPQRQISQFLRKPDEEWPRRFDLLAEHVLPQVPLLLFLDNFEDNLGDPDAAGVRPLANPALADLLARWLAQPEKSRLVVTCRHPFALPDGAQRRLDDHHLGPLSMAEMRKLIWRLPALNALSPEDQQRAYRDVGGHPRALEYLDALLRGGEARFRDVSERLEKQLAAGGVADPGAWMRKETEGDLDRALAETVTATAGDALLADLLRLLDDHPLARQLLIGASVYRAPVEETALAWQVSEEVERPPDPEWEALRGRVHAAMRTFQETGDPEAFAAFSEDEQRAYREGAERSVTPPLQVPDGFAEAKAHLERLGLLSPLPGGEVVLYQVHRWTASRLATETDASDLQNAHHRAAHYWRWRVRVIPQNRQDDIVQLLEARHHHHAAGELDEAVEVTEWVCSQHHTWGAYTEEERLCRETLEWVPERSAKAAAFLHQLGIVAQARGSYDEALEWYRKSLAIKEELGNRAGMASSYHQLGMVAQERGAYDEALEWYRKSLAIEEELGDRSGVAGSYHQLGNVSYFKGSYEDALEWYRRSLAILEKLEDRARMAISYHQLGVVAQKRGSYEEALEWYRKSLAIKEELGNRAGMAISYHQLGRVAQERGSHDEALGWYRQSLAIEEELGNRAGMASSYGQIGALLTRTERVEEAVGWSLRSLAIHSAIGTPQVATDLLWLSRQREALGEGRFGEVLGEHLDEEGVGNVLRMVDQIEAARGAGEEAEGGAPRPDPSRSSG